MALSLFRPEDLPVEYHAHYVSFFYFLRALLEPSECCHGAL
jgi:hypothetical protein